MIETENSPSRSIERINPEWVNEEPETGSNDIPDDDIDTDDPDAPTESTN